MGDVGVVIPAAGQGKRMEMGQNKQFITLAGFPILVHTIKVFQSSKYISEIVIVGANDDLPIIEELVREYDFNKVTAVTQGGAQRQASVFAGVKTLSSAIQRVVVHDGARPLLLLAELDRFLLDSINDMAAVMAIPVKDTIKRVDERGLVVDTLARASLRAVQTPQVFQRVLLEEAHRYAVVQGFFGTDDASLVEYLGHPVRVVDGSWENLKITTPEDLWVAERIFQRRITPQDQTEL